MYVQESAESVKISQTVSHSKNTSTKTTKKKRTQNLGYVNWVYNPRKSTSYIIVFFFLTISVFYFSWC